MTIKQVIVGGLLGATALAALLHRLPKTPTTVALKPTIKHDDSAPRSPHRASRKASSEVRFTFNKLG